jgi:hypothetical protein
MASLNNVGQTQLGRSGAVSLDALAEDGYTRTQAVSGYRRVSPFQVELGRAEDPDTWAAPHSLDDWNGYTQNDVPAGDDLAVAGGYGTIDLDWVRPAGYTRATAIVNQRLYVKDTGETEFNATSLSVDPFDSPDQSQSSGDGDSDTDNVAAYEGNVIAIGLLAEFDDSVAVHESLGYDGAAGEQDLIGAGVGIAAQVFASDPGPVTAVQTTDPDTCQTLDPVNIQISVDMQGPSTGTLQRSTNGGAFATVDASVGAGTQTINRSETSGSNYAYRLRYNDVSPDTWATMVGTVSAVCNLA